MRAAVVYPRVEFGHAVQGAVCFFSACVVWYRQCLGGDAWEEPQQVDLLGRAAMSNDEIGCLVGGDAPNRLRSTSRWNHTLDLTTFMVSSTLSCSSRVLRLRLELFCRMFGGIAWPVWHRLAAKRQWTV